MRTRVLGLLLALAACATARVPAVGTDETNVPDRTADDAIHRYVARSRSWSPDQYRIEERGGEAGLVIYLVVHGDDERSLSGQMSAGAARKSFLVYFDPRAREVVRESSFQ
jgi:hypothetical protein